MGKRGFKPEPAALKRAKGNLGHRPIVEDVQFAEGAPEMPAHLDASARRIWRETLPLLLSVKGLLTIADGAMLSNFCEVRSRRLALVHALDNRRREMLKAAKKAAEAKGAKLTREQLTAIADEKAMTVETRGCPQQHPLIGMINTLLREEAALARSFGLDPSARSSLKLAGGAGIAAIDPSEAAISTPPPDYVERIN